jgi:hypothetical protein
MTDLSILSVDLLVSSCFNSKIGLDANLAGFYRFIAINQISALTDFWKGTGSVNPTSITSSSKGSH